jgi:hypothetical protein
MSVLRDDEIRRLLKFLREKIEDAEKLAFIEDELRSDFGAEFLREPEILNYFPTEIVSISNQTENWKLKIIPYTKMRMIQRGIKREEIANLFARFLKQCESENEIVTVGAYTIFGKSDISNSQITLRIDIDNIEENKAHTVTVFIGQGDTTKTTEVNLIS